MKSLLILRHAKSSWNHAHLSDHERPLNARGKRDAPRLGRLLRRQEMVPELIISSSARRALDTAEAAADACGYEGEAVLVSRDLYHASPEDYIVVLREVAEGYQRVMVVGHNPGMAELVDVLSGESVRMPTAALALIALPINSWSELEEDTEGRLTGYWIPKELER